MKASILKQLFGRRIRELRVNNNLTQEKIAEVVGCSAEYISRIERGLVSPSFEIIARLSDALATSPKSLFDFKEPINSPLDK